jgi:rhombotail lipoprotein
MMIENLDLQLTRFKDKVKERPEEYQIVHSPVYKDGGGSMDWALLTISRLPLALRRRKSRHTPN